MLPESFDDFINGPSVILGIDRFFKERTVYSMNKLKNSGFFNIVYYKGVDGYIDNLEDITNLLNIKIHESIIKQKGCYGFTLSSIKLWKKIIDENLNYLIIFEDDALPHPDFKNIARNWYKNTPKDIDIMYMGSRIVYSKPSNNIYVNKDLI